MIAVETVIRKLANECEFVIIPGFGALLSHQAQAFYNAETGVFSPPKKRLAFNEFLKLDDGLLANYISRHEQISHAEAVTHVRNYTETLRSALKANEHAVIEGIGEFITNGEGKLVFEPKTDRYFRDEWYGFRNTTARMVENKPALVELPVVDLHQDHVEVLEEEKGKNFKVNWLGWASAAMIAGLMCYFSLFFVSGNGENKSNLNPFTSLFENERNSSPEKPVTVNVPVVKKTEAPAVKALPSKPAVIESKKEPFAAEAAEPVSRLKSKQSANFYLIAGTFKGNKQANVLLDDLKSKGFTNAVVLNANQYSKKYKVAVDGFEDETLANQANAKLRKVTGVDGWVYKKK